MWNFTISNNHACMYAYLISWYPVDGKGPHVNCLFANWKLVDGHLSVSFDTHNLGYERSHNMNLTISKRTLCWWGAQIKLNHHDKSWSINLCTNETSWQALSLCIIFWRDLEELWLTWMLDHPILTSTPLYKWCTYIMKCVEAKT